MMSHQTVIVLDFGGQYNQLIARRVLSAVSIARSSPTAPLGNSALWGPILHLHRQPQLRL